MSKKSVMPLVCAGTQLLRKCAAKPDHEVCDIFVTAVDGAVKAKSEVHDVAVVPLSAQNCHTIRGEDVSLLTVLQREMGSVAPTEYNPVSKCSLQSRIASIDATTCIIAAIRDPYSGTTVLGHFDQPGIQMEDGLPAMLNFLPQKPVTTYGLLSTEDRDAVEELQTRFNAKRVVQLYLLGAFKHPQHSAENCAGLLRLFADDSDVVYDVALQGTCVWKQNVRPGTSRVLHRGLMVDAKSGIATPVQCDKLRAYPAGRLRTLRFFDAEEKRLSSVTLMPGETVSTPMTVDEDGRRKALQYVLIVRPFKFPAFSVIVARKPLASFAAMSTSPEDEPEDFAETLKSSIVFASLTTWEKTFAAHPKNQRVHLPVAFQLAIEKESEQQTPAADGDASSPAAAETTAASAAQIAFSWVQISPARSTDDVAAATAPAS